MPMTFEQAKRIRAAAIAQMLHDGEIKSENGWPDLHNQAWRQVVHYLRGNILRGRDSQDRSRPHEYDSQGIADAKSDYENKVVLDKRLPDNTTVGNLLDKLQIDPTLRDERFMNAALISIVVNTYDLGEVILGFPEPRDLNHISEEEQAAIRAYLNSLDVDNQLLKAKLGLEVVYVEANDFSNDDVFWLALSMSRRKKVLTLDASQEPLSFYNNLDHMPVLADGDAVRNFLNSNEGEVLRNALGHAQRVDQYSFPDSQALLVIKPFMVRRAVLLAPSYDAKFTRINNFEYLPALPSDIGSPPDHARIQQYLNRDNANAQALRQFLGLPDAPNSINNDNLPNVPPNLGSLISRERARLFPGVLATIDNIATLPGFPSNVSSPPTDIEVRGYLNRIGNEQLRAALGFVDARGGVIEVTDHNLPDGHASNLGVAINNRREALVERKIQTLDIASLPAFPPGFVLSNDKVREYLNQDSVAHAELRTALGFSRDPNSVTTFNLSGDAGPIAGFINTERARQFEAQIRAIATITHLPAFPADLKAAPPAERNAQIRTYLNTPECAELRRALGFVNAANEVIDVSEHNLPDPDPLVNFINVKRENLFRDAVQGITDFTKLPALPQGLNVPPTDVQVREYLNKDTTGHSGLRVALGFPAASGSVTANNLPNGHGINLVQEINAKRQTFFATIVDGKDLTALPAFLATGHPLTDDEIRTHLSSNASSSLRTALGFDGRVVDAANLPGPLAQLVASINGRRLQLFDRVVDEVKDIAGLPAFNPLVAAPTHQDVIDYLNKSPGCNDLRLALGFGAGGVDTHNLPDPGALANRINEKRATFFPAIVNNLELKDLPNFPNNVAALDATSVIEYLNQAHTSDLRGLLGFPNVLPSVTEHNLPDAATLAVLINSHRAGLLAVDQIKAITVQRPELLIVAKAGRGGQEEHEDAEAIRTQLAAHAAALGIPPAEIPTYSDKMLFELRKQAIIKHNELLVNALPDINGSPELKAKLLEAKRPLENKQDPHWGEPELQVLMKRTRREHFETEVHEKLGLPKFTDKEIDRMLLESRARAFNSPGVNIGPYKPHYITGVGTPLDSRRFDHVKKNRKSYRDRIEFFKKKAHDALNSNYDEKEFRQLQDAVFEMKRDLTQYKKAVDEDFKHDMDWTKQHNRLEHVDAGLSDIQVIEQDLQQLFAAARQAPDARTVIQTELSAGEQKALTDAGLVGDSVAFDRAKEQAAKYLDDQNISITSGMYILNSGSPPAGLGLGQGTKEIKETESRFVPYVVKVEPKESIAYAASQQTPPPSPPPIKTATVQTRTSNGASSLFVLPANVTNPFADVKPETEFFSRRLLSKGRIIIPGVPCADWAATNVKNLLSIAPDPTQKIHLIKGNMPDDMYNALCLYCRYQKLNYGPENKALTASHDALFKEKYFAAHPDDPGHEERQKMAEKTKRPGGPK